jgi:hypothetical protein
VKKVYISYSRRGDYSFISKLIKTADKSYTLCSSIPGAGKLTLSEPEGAESQGNEFEKWDVVYDENGVDPGESIEGYMDELSEGQNIIFLLSDGYFESPFCMKELLAIYNKRAGEIFPVIVLSKDFSPGNVTIDSVVDHWRNEYHEQHSEGVRNICQKFIGGLPLALTWLLGPYNTSLQYYEKRYIAETEFDAVKKVFEQLAQKFELRYRIFSLAERDNHLTLELGRIVRQMKKYTDYFEDFKKTLDLPQGRALCDALVGVTDPDTLVDVLLNIGIFLKKNTKSTPAPSELVDFCGDIKPLVGWLLLKAVDMQKLTMCVHRLNDQQKDAHIDLSRENDTAFQVLASSLLLTTVGYTLHDEDGGKKLRAAGEVRGLEQGASLPNYLTQIQEGKTEDIMRGIYGQVYEQYSGEPEAGCSHPDMQSLKAGIADILKAMKKEGYPATFLTLDRKFLDGVSKETEFRTEIGGEFPDMTQIIECSRTMEQVEKAGCYFIEGLESGALQERIKTIYIRLDRLINGKQTIA